MTERSAEQAPVQTRPETHDGTDDTARIPLAERLQRRLSTAGEQRNGSPSSRSGGRVLPPPPPELAAEKTRAQEQARAEQARADAARAEAARAEQARAEAARGNEGERRGPSLVAAPVATPVAAAPTTTQPPVPAPAVTTRRTTATQGPSRVPRRARLRLSRVDPWSVMKVSFLLSIAFGIVTVVSVFIVWSVLGAAGVWTSINHTVSDTVSSGSTSSTFDVQNYVGMSRVLGFTMLVSVIDVVLITAIATLGAFLYNMAASLLGGVEVTLSEDQG